MAKTEKLARQVQSLILPAIEKCLGSDAFLDDAHGDFLVCGSKSRDILVTKVRSVGENDADWVKPLVKALKANRTLRRCTITLMGVQSIRNRSGRKLPLSNPTDSAEKFLAGNPDGWVEIRLGH